MEKDLGVTTAPSAATAPWQNGPENPGFDQTRRKNNANTTK